MSDDASSVDPAEEWISSATAKEMVGSYQTSMLCKRAHVGLVKTRAEQFIFDKNVFDDVDLPTEFWWAEGHDALIQNWKSGDFETWLEQKHHLRAFGVRFRRSDVERALPIPTSQTETLKGRQATMAGKHIFIGHGRSLIWMELREFLQIRLKLTVDEFNRVPIAGISTANRLSQMLNDAAFALLILTAEDQQGDGKVYARMNVIHEAGLFQGRLGLERAIIMLEEGCEEFSNIHGLGQIRFPKGKISAAFEDVRSVLERENVTP